LVAEAVDEDGDVWEGVVAVDDVSGVSSTRARDDKNTKKKRKKRGRKKKKESGDPQKDVGTSHTSKRASPPSPYSSAP
jgi:hypothetical protein